MPTYEYACPKCGRFEYFQGINDSALRECPRCGKGVTRIISGGAGLIFKGSGFYITDYRGDDYRKRAKEDGAKSKGNGDGAAAGKETPTKSAAGTPKETSSDKTAQTGGNGAAGGKDAGAGEK